MRTMRLAEQLGAETTVLSGTNVSEEIVAYAQQRNVSKLVIGKPARPRWKEILLGSVADELIRRSGDVDVYVITGDKEPQETETREEVLNPVDYLPYFKAFIAVALATAVDNLLIHRIALVNLVMIYQLALVVISIRYGRGPSIMASILSVAACDYYFVPPYYTFAVTDSQYLLTLAVMLLVALSISTLTNTVKNQAETARRRERKTAALYAMTREQAVAVTKESVLTISIKHIKEVFGSQVSVMLCANDGQLAEVSSLEGVCFVDAHELGVAQWVFINGKIAGAGTSTLPGAKAIYLPLRGSTGSIGVIGLLSAEPKRFQHPEEMHLLETFVNQTALAVERALLSEQAQKAAQHLEG